MRKSKRRMRREILIKLCEHLKQEYGVQCSSETFLEGRMPSHQLDAVLAFKSDPFIDELRSALDRLDAGTYGICIGCKQLVHQQLLDVEPARRVCATCEELYFRQGENYLPGGVFQGSTPTVDSVVDNLRFRT